MEIAARISRQSRSSSRGSTREVQLTVGGGDSKKYKLIDDTGSKENNEDCSRPDLDVVQFAAPIYYVEEDDSTIQMEIMRLGSLDGPVSVHYRTEDGSARAGEHYCSTSGQVEILEGEDSVEIAVPVIDNPLWAPTLEFKVHLSDAHGCRLGLYLKTCRVKVINTDLFPSDRYREKLESEGGIDDMNGLILFWEYMALNFRQRGHAWRTLLTFAMDQMDNLYLYWMLFAKTFLVNTIFGHQATTTDSFLGSWDGSNRVLAARILGVCFFLPLVLIHIWDAVKIQIDLKGHTQVFLQKSLFRKYLNYSEESRLHVSASKMSTAVMHDVEELAGGYTAAIGISKRLGRLGIVLFFVLEQDPHAAWIVCVMPLLMLIWFLIRRNIDEGDEEVTRRHEIQELLADTCAHYRLIADYAQRPQMNDIFSEKASLLRNSAIVRRMIDLNNGYFPRWLGPLFMGIYTAVMSPEVLQGNLTLGVFLSTLGVFSEISEAFAGIYEATMEINSVFGPLKEITTYFNLETDLQKLCMASRVRKTCSSIERQTMKRTTSTMQLGWDLIDIQVKNMTFGYGREVLFQDVNISVAQGKLVAIVGPQRSGKGTFMRLLCSTYFPSEGEIIIPSHLRVLMVPQEPVLLDISAWKNLVFGIPDMQDVDMVLGILKALDMPKVIALVNQELDEERDGEIDHANDSKHLSCECCYGGASPVAPHTKTDTSWTSQLSYTDRANICLVRALLMNPEMLILQRPLHFYQPSEQSGVMRIIRQHIANRGIGLPKDTKKYRRPRTLFFSPETPEQTKEADLIWQIDPVTKSMYLVHHRRVSQGFIPWRGPNEMAAGPPN